MGGADLPVAAVSLGRAPCCPAICFCTETVLVLAALSCLPLYVRCLSCIRAGDVVLREFRSLVGCTSEKSQACNNCFRILDMPHEARMSDRVEN